MTVDRIVLCASEALQEGANAVPFDVVYAGHACRAFAIRFEGQAHAYLNRCTHVAMEMDYQPDRFSMIPGVGCCAQPMVRSMRRTAAPALAAPAVAAW